MARPFTAVVRTVSINSIQLNRTRARCKTQARCKIHNGFVDDYAEMKRNGVVFDMPVLFFDDKRRYWVGNGYHRLYADLKNGNMQVECEVRPGGWYDAFLYNIESNKKHRGIPLTDGDKQHSVQKLLNIAENRLMSDGFVADMVGCSAATVCNVRKNMTKEGVKFPDRRMGKDGVVRSKKEIAKRLHKTKKLNVQVIGKKAAPKPAPASMTAPLPSNARMTASLPAKNPSFWCQCPGCDRVFDAFTHPEKQMNQN